jgi:hypothetical protein
MDHGQNQGEEPDEQDPLAWRIEKSLFGPRRKVGRHGTLEIDPHRFPAALCHVFRLPLCVLLPWVTRLLP